MPLGLLVLPERPGRPGVQVAQVQPEVQVARAVQVQPVRSVPQDPQVQPEARVQPEVQVGPGLPDQ